MPRSSSSSRRYTSSRSHSVARCCGGQCAPATTTTTRRTAVTTMGAGETTAPGVNRGDRSADRRCPTRCRSGVASAITLVSPGSGRPVPVAGHRAAGSDQACVRGEAKRRDRMSAQSLVVFVTLVAMSVWVGGLVTIALVTRVVRRRLPPVVQVDFFRDIGRSFGVVAALALVVALAGGAATVGADTWGEGTTLTGAAIAVALTIATA